MSKPGVLIVDDTQEARFLAKQILKARHYSIFEASSGQEALDILKAREDIVAVLLDLFLQDMDGFEVMENLKRLNKKLHPKICIMSARQGDDIVMKAQLSGASRCLFKPLLPSSLIETLDELVGT